MKTTSLHNAPTPAGHAGPSDHGDEHDEHDEGLATDLPRLLAFAVPGAATTDVVTPPAPALIGRRRLLGMGAGLVGGVGAMTLLAACGSGSSGSAGSTATTATTAPTAGSTADGNSGTAASADSTAATASAGSEIPDETAGPYPGDGTNGPNALTESGVVRTDIRSSFGSSNGTADGIETTMTLTIADAATGDPIPGAALYLWHCNRDGQYSMYDITNENYLRGVQVADDAGVVHFTSIFPGCYSGRWPHAHFEVYGSIDDATVGSNAIKTSQIAYPEAACNEAYTATGYESSVTNLSRVSLATDNVFRDGAEDQLAAITGSPSDGFELSLLIRI